MKAATMKKPTLTTKQFLDATGHARLDDFHHQCHVASIALVQSGVLGVPCRVARGTCPDVGGQHSWVVVGMDCYDADAWIVDPTLWSYDPGVKGIWIGKPTERLHMPHGMGNIWTWGKPTTMGGEPVELAVMISNQAQAFLDLLGPLDRTGWNVLLSDAPVGGWPAAEIIEAASRTPKLSALVPIDRLGMLTDQNPGGVYL